MARDESAPVRFVVLPPTGTRPSAEFFGDLLAQLGGLTSASAARKFAASCGIRGGRVECDIRVLDSVRDDGPKLLEMSAESANNLRAREPGLRIVPEVFFAPAHVRYAARVAAPRATLAVKTPITVVARAGGEPIRGATVVAFTDFAAGIGAEATSKADGTAAVALGSAKKIERIYVYAPPGWWGGFRRNVVVKKGTDIVVRLTAIDPADPDCLRHFYGSAELGVGAGVKVGVVDTGVGPHADLEVAGGANLVLGEDPADHADNGAGHGTHVAGIIAARGAPPTGVRGLAPAVKLHSYRVFGKDQPGASNFAILKAIDRAVSDGCDLVNLSLGGGVRDPAIASAIQDARAAGTLVVAAAGNEERAPVSFPAAEPSCVAISALGVKGMFPRGAMEEADVREPFGTDPAEFIAGFSNVGMEIDLVGPGVGVISTVPGGLAPMSGTSMASPAVVGVAARLLAADSATLAMQRDQARSDAIARAVLTAGVRRGFPPSFEGSGLPLP
ncbi:MAG: S8 family serine peptidase [Pirellulales bacterium]